MPWFKRLAYCLLGWGTVGVVYSTTDALQAQGNILSPSFIDIWLGFTPLAIWPYLSFFLFIPLAYFCAEAQKVKPLAHAMQLAALVSGLIFLLFPTTINYPEFATQQSLSSHYLRQLIVMDSPQNLLPSLHVSLSVLALWGLWQSGKTVRNCMYLLWLSAICLSILLLKRHLFIDLISGLTLALLLIYGYAEKSLRKRCSDE